MDMPNIDSCLPFSMTCFFYVSCYDMAAYDNTTMNFMHACVYMPYRANSKLVLGYGVYVRVSYEVSQVRN